MKTLLGNSSQINPASVIWLNRLLLLLAVSYGAYMRWIFIDQPLWLDESWRAIMISSGPFTFEKNVYAGITPVGYFYLEQIFIKLFSNTEMVLRLPSFLSGMLLIPLFWLAGKKLEPNTLLPSLFALLIALNPTLIQYSKELKPYIIECLVHGIIIYLAIRTWKENNHQTLTWINFAALVGLFFAVNTVIAWGAVIVCTGLTMLTGGVEGRVKKQVAVIFLTTLATIAALYALQWRFPNQDGGLMLYWKDNFYVQNGNLAGYIAWVSHKTFELFKDILLTKITLLVMFVVALAAIIKARDIRPANAPSLLLYPVLVFVLVIGLNYVGKWPFGAIRPNVFLYPYGILLLGLAIGAARNVYPRVVGALVAVTLLSLFSYVLHDYRSGNYLSHRPPVEDIKGFMLQICEANRNGAPKLIAFPLWSFEYYAKYNVQISKECGQGYYSSLNPESLELNPDGLRRLQARLMDKPEQKGVILLAHVDENEYKAIEKSVTIPGRVFHLKKQNATYMVTIDK